MKERIKSVVLVVLVITNLILGSQVLSTKKLWSGDGYNFFVNMSNIPISIYRSIKQRISGKTPTETRLESPELIIINTGYQTSRHTLRSADDDFAPLLEIANAFLTDAFSRPQDFVSVPSDYFRTALTAKSVYLRYPTDYDSSLFAYLLGAGARDFSQSFSQLRNIVISADGYVYIEDSLSGTVYRIRTTESTDELNSVINLHITNDDTYAPVINYAFDLGFDKAFETQKTVLSPMIPIYSEGFERETVTAKQILVSQNGNIAETAISAILPHFSMNPNGLRRYTEVDGTIVFVENNSLLKISNDGYIEYQAKDEGIQLSKGTAVSVHESVAAIASFVDKINRAAGSDSTMQLTSKLTASELSGNTITITLDYLANGSLVRLSDANSHSVTVTVTNGRITSYRHLMRSFETNAEMVSVDDYIYALDNAIARFENQINEIEISGLEIVYEYDGSQSELIPEWHVSVKEIVINE